MTEEKSKKQSKEQPEEKPRAWHENSPADTGMDSAFEQDAHTDETPATDKKDETEKLRQELADYKEKYVRLAAEFDNARKRMEREKTEFVKYANEGLIREFLDILDNLERSVEAAKAKHEDYQAFLKGVEMVMAHIYEMLKKHQVRPIEAKGKRFDPEQHEPLMQEETDQFDEWTILEEFQKGYTFGDRVLRTSKVKVAVRSKPVAEANPSPDGGVVGEQKPNS